MRYFIPALSVALLLLSACGHMDSYKSTKVYYPIKSSVIGPKLFTSDSPAKMTLTPYSATLKLTGISDGRYDLSVDYLFNFYNVRQEAFLLDFKALSLTSLGGGNYEVHEENALGSGMIQNDLFAFENVSINGIIGPQKGAYLTIIGTVSGKEFTLMMDSFTKKADEAPSLMCGAVEVDQKAYFELSVSNDSDMDCSLSLQMAWQSNEEATIASNQRYQTKFLLEEAFWGGECRQVGLAFADGYSMDFTGYEVFSQQEEVTQYFQLTDRKRLWHLQGYPDGSIQKRYFACESYSIRRPNLH